MADLTGMMQAAAGGAGGGDAYIEDVFSTYLYTGNGSTQTITNGIDLAGEGGMVWGKRRDSSGYNNVIQDTVRGAGQEIQADLTNAQLTRIDAISSFNSDGFSFTGAGGNQWNQSAGLYASWTFRKAPKFFDVVTYTGTGVARTVSHNLGSVPGCIMVKRTDTTGDWQVYHRANTANPETDYLVLNSTAATADSNTRWNDTAPTDAVFSLGTEATVNASGGTYVAYLFAHDAGGFGDDGEQNVISCGSYTGNGADDGPTIDLGFEPQWLLVKRASGGTAEWALIDNMRGFTADGSDAVLKANAADAEGTQLWVSPNSTGFKLRATSSAVNASGSTYIYIAIRRGPMKTPTSGTEVFEPKSRTGTGAVATISGVGFAPDMVVSQSSSVAVGAFWWDKLRGASRDLKSYSTSAEVNDSSTMTAFTNDGIIVGVDSGQAAINNTGWVYSNWYFQRAPGFFDEVCYTGTGANRTVAHNLGAVPELMIVKSRSNIQNWAVYSSAVGNTGYLILNTTDAAVTGVSGNWNDTTPTETVFTVGTDNRTNNTSWTYVAYLFASLAGVSDIGSYTGNGSSVTVTTGFQPRFILVKRTDSTGNWIQGDSARGLVAADESALFLNTTGAATTGQDWVDVSATGFTVNETALNACVSTATYIYLAIS